MGTYCNLIDDWASSITVGGDGDKANVKINNEEPIKMLKYLKNGWWILEFYKQNK